MEFYILFFLLFILFIPFPIKVTLSFIENKITLKFFNITILPSKKSKKSKSKTQKVKSNKSKNKKKKNKNDDKKKSKSSLTKNLNINTVRNIINDISKSKFKPSLRFDLNLEYSLNDASNTAISFGLLNCINPIFYNIFYSFFNLKRFLFNIKPLFVDKFIFNLEIKSIIFVSLAQIIYIICLVLKNLLFRRR